MSTRGRRTREAGDPRITALGSTLLAELARVLSRAPLERSRLGELVGYLDYIDHAVYSPDEIAGLLDELVRRGLARRTDDTWTFVPATRSS